MTLKNRRGVELKIRNYFRINLAPIDLTRKPL